MAIRTTTRQAAFLPPGVADFLRRRIRDCVGIALFAAAAFITGALLSYHPADPSWNSANGIAVQNWLAAPGAYTADLLLQTFGLAGAVPVLILVARGWRMVSHRGLPWFTLHLILVPIALIAPAAFVSLHAPPPSWPLGSGLGGIVGDVTAKAMLVTLSNVNLNAWSVVLQPAVGMVAAFALLFSLGISLREWLSMAKASVWSARRMARASLHAARFAGRLGRAAADLTHRREPRLFGRSTADDDTETASLPARRRLARESTVAAPRQRVVKRTRQEKKSTRARTEDQPTLDFGPDGAYRLPPLHLLQQPDGAETKQAVNEDALEQNARLLEAVLDDYGVRGNIVKVRPGPVVALYELEPAPGTKTSRVIGLADDIARSMSALSVRVAVVPGRNAIGIELPNQHREMVYLRALLATREYEHSGGDLNLALGKDIGGTPVIADLAKMPHLLIAGTTGSGKSVAINTMILSLLYRLTPQECRLIMIDPKMLELSVYDDIPHLLTPVVTDPGKAVVALKWTVREMEQRYKSMARLGVRNIAGYNQRLADAAGRGEALKRTVQTGFDSGTGKPIFEEENLELEPMPFIVVVVDEMADLMMVAGKDIEGAIQRLAQMARAAGIHIIMATQRPSVDVITGTIKANFPTRISFQVTAKVDSRTILGEQGAEQLLGQGDMLHMVGGGRIARVHGPFVSDEEVEQVVAYLKQQGQPEYLDAVTEEPEESDTSAFLGGDTGSGNELYDRAVDIVAQHQKASTSFIQRHLQIGYNRAARLMEQMEADGAVGPANHVGKREIFLPKPEEY